jgi:hypothetical protein
MRSQHESKRPELDIVKNIEKGRKQQRKQSDGRNEFEGSDLRGDYGLFGSNEVQELVSS